MLRMLFNKKNSVYLPYKVKLDSDRVIIEASGEYNESYLVFHGIITSKNIDIKTIYIRLNETMYKNITIRINTRDVNRFKFDFTNMLHKDEIDDISVIDKRVLKEVTI